MNMTREDRLANLGCAVAIAKAKAELELEDFMRRAKPRKAKGNTELLHDFLGRIKPEQDRLRKKVETLARRLHDVRVARKMEGP